MKMLSTDSATSSFAVDEASNTIRFVRQINASPERVVAAWTIPEQLSDWWDPTGEKLSVCDVDLRPGGVFRFASSHHPERPFTGTYREISPPGRLVFEAGGAVGTVQLDGQATGTRMTVEIACRSAEHLAQFVAMGIASGTSLTLNNLVRYARLP